MTEKLAKWPSNDRQIIKSRLSSRRRGKSLPSAVDSAYHWTRYEFYLGNDRINTGEELCASKTILAACLPGHWNL